MKVHILATLGGHSAPAVSFLAQLQFHRGMSVKYPPDFGTNARGKSVILVRMKPSQQNTNIFLDINHFAQRTPWLHGIFQAIASYGILLFVILLIVGGSTQGEKR